MKRDFKSTLLHRASRRFYQNIALYFLGRQLSAQPADFPLLGARRLTVHCPEPASTLGLHPVEQPLPHDPQHSGCPGSNLSAIHQPDRCLFGLGRVAPLLFSSFPRSLSELKHSARGELFRDKVTNYNVPRSDFYVRPPKWKSRPGFRHVLVPEAG